MQPASPMQTPKAAALLACLGLIQSTTYGAHGRLAKRDASRQDRKPTASMKGLALTFLLLTWIMARNVSCGRDPDRLAVNAPTQWRGANRKRIVKPRGFRTSPRPLKYQINPSQTVPVRAPTNRKTTRFAQPPLFSQENECVTTPPVAPFAGARIETAKRPDTLGGFASRSLRGSVDRNILANPPRTGAARRSLRGSVDRNGGRATRRGHEKVAPFAGAWIETRRPRARRGRCPVAPFAGAWIETPIWSTPWCASPRRSLRGSVDRNIRHMRIRATLGVAPFAGAWIHPK